MPSANPKLHGTHPNGLGNMSEHTMQRSQFPREVIRYTLIVSVLWLIVSASLLFLEHHEVDQAMERVIALQPVPAASLARFESQGAERKEQQNQVHGAVWLFIQLCVIGEAIRVGRSIRERRSAQEQLRDATLRIESLTHQPSLGYIRIDRQGKIVDVNDPWLAMHGIGDRTQVLDTLYTFDHAGDGRPRNGSLVQAIANGTLPPMGETTHVRPDGSMTHYSYAFHPTGSKGAGNGVEGFLVDITERKRAEEARVTSERRYRALFENHIAGCAIHKVIADSEGRPYDYRILDINDAFAAMLGLRWGNVVGGSLSDLGPGFGKEWHEHYASVAATGRAARFEIWHEPLNKWFEVQAFRPEPGYLAALLVDITVQRAASSTLQRSLDEKSALLKELHHRVKNNLQVLSSLINLHSSVLQNPAERDLLKNYQRRIRSVALVHEAMYKAPDLSHVDFGEYLHAAVMELQESFHLPSVEYRVHAGIHLLAISTAIPCGMIVSELVTNALRHGIKPGSHGVLDVSLHTTDGGTEIVIRDDGPGFVVSEHRRMGTSVGLFLVDVLIEQLEGRLEITSDSMGTTCKVMIPMRER
jgi:PAS domain S-box-containing protein